MNKFFEDFENLPEINTCTPMYYLDNIGFPHVETEIDDFPEEWMKGVYFLILSGYVVYVGITTNAYNRIVGNGFHSSHSESKLFDSVKFLSTPEKQKGEIEELERVYIKLFDPYYNVKDKPLNRDFYNKLPSYYKNREIIFNEKIEPVRIAKINATRKIYMSIH